MKEVTVQELKSMMDNKEDFQLIDVREKNEYEFVNIDAELIPVGEFLESADKVSTDKKVIIHCRSGARSGQAILAIQAAHGGYENLYNLKGGILAWAKEIDTSLPTY